jgi:hypothetical protein
MNESEFCRALRGTVAVARQTVAAGDFVDLAGFDGEVAALCEAVSRLPTAEWPAIAAELGALLGELEELSSALTAQNGIETGTTRRRAAEAYVPPSKPA